MTHLDETGRARMVDVGAKPETLRTAIAEAWVRMSPETLALVVAGSGKKGDVIATARLAGIAALKRTAELIPLCHPVRVVGSDVSLAIEPGQGVWVRAEVSAFDRTGVEMEAMVAAAVAALTVYDMVKGVERGVTITAVRLLEKRGGRSGLWRQEKTVGSVDSDETAPPLPASKAVDGANRRTPGARPGDEILRPTKSRRRRP